MDDEWASFVTHAVKRRSPGSSHRVKMSDSKPESEDELAGTEQPFVAHLMELRDRLIKSMDAMANEAARNGLTPEILDQLLADES